jgi:hypothetical protein
MSPWGNNVFNRRKNSSGKHRDAGRYGVGGFDRSCEHCARGIAVCGIVAWLSGNPMFAFAGGGASLIALLLIAAFAPSTQATKPAGPSATNTLSVVALVAACASGEVPTSYFNNHWRKSGKGLVALPRLMPKQSGCSLGHLLPTPEFRVGGDSDDLQAVPMRGGSSGSPFSTPRSLRPWIGVGMP